MDKSKFKKLALMGITGGIILAAQAPAEASSFGSTLAAGCGSGCGAKSKPSSPSFTADNGCGAKTSQQQYRTYNQPEGSQASSSCASRPSSSQQQYPSYTAEHASCGAKNYTQPQQQTASCAGRSAPQQQYNSQTAGCASRSAPQPQYNSQTASCAGRSSPSQPSLSAGCAGRSAPQQYNTPTASCGGRSSPSQPNTQTAGCGAPSSTRGQYQGQGSNQGQSRYYTADAADAVANQKKLSESELVNQLNPESKATFQSMSPEGKALALKLANQACQGKNECKGLNSCKTSENSCAGTGSCKGTSPGPFTDKNKAVKVAAKKMLEKRSAINGNR